MTGLPRRVIDSLLYYSRGDRRSLHAFSLVSRSWCKCARRWLFYSVKVDSCASPCDDDVSPVEAFINLISTSTDIAQSVRMLELNLSAQMEPISATSLGTLLCRLPRLYSLGVHNSGFYGDLVLIGQPCLLTHLTLYRIWDGDGLFTLPQLLRLFPELKELRTESLSPLFVRTTPSETAPYLHLSTMSLLEPTAQLLILASEMIASCEALEITLSGSVSKHIATFVNCIAADLVDLQLVVPSNASSVTCTFAHKTHVLFPLCLMQSTDYDSLRLEACTSLRTVIFIEPPPIWETPSWSIVPQNYAWHTTLDLLQKLPHTVTHVQIELSNSSFIPDAKARVEDIKPWVLTKLGRFALGPIMAGDPRGEETLAPIRKLHAEGIVGWLQPSHHTLYGHPPRVHYVYEPSNVSNCVFFLHGV